MCIAFIILLYIIILTMIMTRNTSHLMQHHTSQAYRANQKCYNAFFYSIFIFSLLMFEILLTSKLDHDMYSTDIMHQFHSLLQSSHNLNNNYRNYVNEFTNFNNQNVNKLSSASTYSGSSSFTLVSIPLYMAYLSLICLSFNSRSGNTWWFGMRRDFCDIFLTLCPVFQTYGNIQIKFAPKSPTANPNETTSQHFTENSSIQTNNALSTNRRPNIVVNQHQPTRNEQTVSLIDNASNQTSTVTLNATTQRNLSQAWVNQVEINHVYIFNLSKLQT